MVSKIPKLFIIIENTYIMKWKEMFLKKNNTHSINAKLTPQNFERKMGNSKKVTILILLSNPDDPKRNLT